MPRAPTDPRTERQILARYDAGSSLADAAAPFGLTAKATKNALARAGRTPRSRSDGQATRHAQGRTTRTHAVNALAFALPLRTEAAAYWLGFLSTFGRISPTRIEVEVQPEDEPHLVALLDFLGSDAPITDHPNAGATETPRRAVVSSVALVQALLVLGVGPDKATYLAPLMRVSTVLPPALHRHYCRGALDGGGGFSTSQGGWKVHLIGPRAFVQSFRTYLVANGIATSAAVRPHGPSYRLEVGGTRNARDVAWLLYAPGTIVRPTHRAAAERLLALGSKDLEDG